MNNHNIVFPLNQTTNIILILEGSLKLIDSCYEEYIFLHDNKTNYLIGKGSIYYNMQQLVNHLQKASTKKLFLHSSIKEDIGFLLNEYHVNENNFVIYDFPDGPPDWIGYLYQVWQANSDNLRLTTWLYNNIDSSIVLEITPFYPYMYCEPTEEPNYVPYDIWIKSYEPYFKTILSQKIAETWLKQAQHIIKIIEDNETAWQKEKLKK